MRFCFAFLHQRAAFPFRCGGGAQQRGNGGGNVQQTDLLQSLTLLPLGAVEGDGNGHVLGHLGAVSAGMAAVVGGDDHGEALGQSVVELLDVLGSQLHSCHVFLAHPAVLVGLLVAVAGVVEHEIRLLGSDIAAGAVAQLHVGVAVIGVVVDENVAAQGAGTAQVTQLMPGVVEEILIECTETRDQPKNRERALSRLRTMIYDREHQKYLDDIASRRKTMVSTGDRSAKIRTYNYPQGRITDHRINYTIYNLNAFMNGEIQDCIDHLIVAENAERMKESEL